MVLDPRDSLLSSYDYPLDPERIAQRPVEPRHAARLLIVQPLGMKPPIARHAEVWDWQEELRAGDLLVINDTRVLKARLRVRRSGGGLAELLVLEPRGEGRWLCLGRPAKRLRPADQLWLEALGEEPIALQVISKDSDSGGRIVQFPSHYANAEQLELLLERYGEVPLPPYIQRHDPSDSERYQTRYASRPGAVAAPTAGLHLSDELLEALKQRGVILTSVTLHVGLGTFRPLETEDLRHLQLHSEWVEVRDEVVEAVMACRARAGRVIAVGTTSVRALEGAALAGGGFLQSFCGPVDLVIQPGYRFAVVDGLLTNFHLPKSSLLLLVSAMVGRERLLALYAEAIEHQYRFFSYGDAMWIDPEAVLPAARPC
ncbi:S-adenosylmethionine:tRNA ribosyltransferase-isomerase [Prochlorococcus marinus str. MIT 1313]|uniref:tRNA preQ1(34) S-adenosylmethionine ribosyltransferase-isomerase QueA n=1 Tax=Prochlorococcus TaxID=1218 RepID=UPI0007B3C751|nr:tRNA preQ1(34) S-adenosylmethionine ribosyltransferase-isomerase QueA [Prochlorococcus marinus]KZR70568.1 S-adenosylmethionine:tRNA ribosyltransferase-isomerase [Prochlorococcus marinus str. MIT 1313]KZR76299.1 S-adenosylmethionine:tRNA ribosyltransferase-isomerase [Prochlorococcus marinus str. MIT 1318]